MRSFIVQLLRYHSFDTTTLHREIDWRGLKSGEIAPLCSLFYWLVRQLPSEITLMCLIDGIAHYENDEYEANMLTVLTNLLRIARDDRLLSAVKLLVTSPSLADKVQEAFKDDESCFVSVAELPWGSQEFSMLQLGDLSDGGESEGSVYEAK